MAKKRKLGPAKAAAAAAAAASTSSPDHPASDINGDPPAADEEVIEEPLASFEPLDADRDYTNPDLLDAAADPPNLDPFAQMDVEPELEPEPKPEYQPKAESDHQIPDSPAADAAAGGESVEEEVENDLASIQKLLESFPKDQLVELLRDAASAHRDVLDRVRQSAEADPGNRKIFVHGLGWDATSETLAAAFREYGEIEDLKVVADKATGRCKGYGFILFKKCSGARRALKQPQKKIGNRLAACQLASLGPVPAVPVPAPVLAPPASEYTQRKIYVSNVGAELDPQKLLQFFAKYGEIEEGPLGLDKVTGKPKGFALFVYKTIESAKKALEEAHKNFEGHVLHCQKAIDGPKPGKPGFHFQGARKVNSGFAGGAASQVLGASGFGHLMAPSGPGVGFNQAGQPAAVAAATGLNPGLGQALTALLSTQGAGVGLGNLLGSAGVNQAQGMQGYGNQVAGVGNSGLPGAYGTAGPGYGNAGMGQGGVGRSQQGHGHMGGIGPYMGH